MHDNPARVSYRGFFALKQLFLVLVKTAGVLILNPEILKLMGPGLLYKLYT